VRFVWPRWDITLKRLCSTTTPALRYTAIIDDRNRMTDKLLNILAPRLVVGLKGIVLNDDERRILSESPPAGIVLFSRNVADAGQLRSLVSEVRDIVIEASGLPPLVAADHEGGRISVLSRAIGTPPAQMAVAKAHDRSLCWEVFRQTAHRMRSCGVNMFLGPVADINTEYLNPVIGTRSFGEEMGEVDFLVGLAVKAFKDSGLLTCMKHFPGHGAAVGDSHLKLPVLGLTVDQLRDRDLVPFARGIQEGADSVMMGHVAPADRRLPSSLDREIVSGLLRGDLGFEGVVVTDALEMAGVVVREMPAGRAGDEESRDDAGRTTTEVIGLALEAGNDLLLFSRPAEEVFGELESSLGEAKTSGSYRIERFDDISGSSLDRIDELRRRAKRLEGQVAGYMEEAPFESGGMEMIASRVEDARPEAYRATAKSSVRVLKDTGSLLPVGSADGILIRFSGERGDFENEVVRGFIEHVLGRLHGRRRGRGVSAGINSDDLFSPEKLRSALRYRMPNSEEVHEFLELVAGDEPKEGAGVLFLLNRKPITGEALSQVCSKADIVVVAGWSYAAHFIHPDKTVIISYGIYEAAADVICDILVGM
ncbi:MAG: glycoside hydrolase family 3 protein, partial [Candidatus Krumholzibacteria bacterium]|nr:glycoside hydrolase family 3 protein [Candidatus Krumholzibacteria bacterium]